jgi:hypothetical protein
MENLAPKGNCNQEKKEEKKSATTRKSSTVPSSSSVKSKWVPLEVPEVPVVANDYERQLFRESQQQKAGPLQRYPSVGINRSSTLTNSYYGHQDQFNSAPAVPAYPTKPTTPFQGNNWATSTSTYKSPTAATSMPPTANTPAPPPSGQPVQKFYQVPGAQPLQPFRRLLKRAITNKKIINENMQQCHQSPSIQPSQQFHQPRPSIKPSQQYHQPAPPPPAAATMDPPTITKNVSRLGSQNQRNRVYVQDTSVSSGRSGGYFNAASNSQFQQVN